MNVLAAALGAIFRDPNASSAAIYTPAGGDPVELRVVSSLPTDQGLSLGAGRMGVTAQSARLDMLRAVVPDQPQRGDVLQVETAPGSGEMGPVRIVADVTTDARDLVWRMVLSDG